MSSLICKRCNRQRIITMCSPDGEIMGACVAGSNACEIIYRARKAAFLAGIAFIEKHINKSPDGTVDWEKVNQQLRNKKLI